MTPSQTEPAGTLPGPDIQRKGTSFILQTRGQARHCNRRGTARKRKKMATKVERNVKKVTSEKVVFGKRSNNQSTEASLNQKSVKTSALFNVLSLSNILLLNFSSDVGPHFPLELADSNS